MDAWWRDDGGMTVKSQFSIKALAVVALVWIDDGGMKMRLQSFIKVLAVVGSLESMTEGSTSRFGGGM